MEGEAIRFLKLHPDAIIPKRATPLSAGFDLMCLENTIINPLNGNTLVPTGIAVQLPEGTYGRIAMRSGLALRQHLIVSAGVIDPDYTGPIGVIVGCMKLGDTYRIEKGERFAQLIIEKVSYAPGVEVSKFLPRICYHSHLGFGSTGKS